MKKAWLIRKEHGKLQKAEGAHNKALTIAKLLLDQGVDIKVIAVSTELTEEEIKQL